MMQGIVFDSLALMLVPKLAILIHYHGTVQMSEPHHLCSDPARLDYTRLKFGLVCWLHREQSTLQSLTHLHCRSPELHLTHFRCSLPPNFATQSRLVITLQLKSPDTISRPPRLGIIPIPCRFDPSPLSSNQTLPPSNWQDHKQA